VKTSEQVNELFAAQSKAQATILGALKDSANPFFKSKYADLASVWDAVRGPLTDNGLCVIQTIGASDTGVSVSTLLGHSSGQWISDTLTLMPKDSSPQSVGSAITYGRRYGLAAITGCPQIDDDANAASGRPSIFAGGTRLDNPRGDLGKDVPIDKAVALADRMREALNLDKTDPEKAADVFVIHEEIKADHDLYVAAADLLKTNERNGWHKLVDLYRKQKGVIMPKRTA